MSSYDYDIIINIKRQLNYFFSIYETNNNNYLVAGALRVSLRGHLVCRIIRRLVTLLYTLQRYRCLFLQLYFYLQDYSIPVPNLFIIFNLLKTAAMIGFLRTEIFPFRYSSLEMPAGNPPGEFI